MSHGRIVPREQMSLRHKSPQPISSSTSVAEPKNFYMSTTIGYTQHHSAKIQKLLRPSKLLIKTLTQKKVNQTFKRTVNITSKYV
jgi:hypothetical protein